jgi:hypothetical protein
MPAGAFGEADELIAAVIWLCGQGASFVTARSSFPVDGGLSAFSEV